MESATTIGKELAPPEDLSRHFSRVTNHRIASKIKQFYKYFAIPGIGQLAGGQSISIGYLDCAHHHQVSQILTISPTTPSKPV